ncbi:MAG: ABC transporter protein, partial [Anaerolineales bacterium]|nr:ABC transporter protein [Anaerolineales bacterium]
MRRLAALAALVLAVWPAQLIEANPGRGESQTRPYDTRGAPLVVSPSGPYTTIESALADAHAGDVIEVRGGTYPGPLVVQTEGVTLEGVDTPNGAPV